MGNNVHICHSCHKIIDQGVNSLTKNLFLGGMPLPMLGGYSFKESNDRVILCYECYEKIKLLTRTKGNQFPGDYIFNASNEDEKLQVKYIYPWDSLDDLFRDFMSEFSVKNKKPARTKRSSGL